MKSHRHRTCPGVERLDDRMLPSAVLGHLPARAPTAELKSLATRPSTPKIVKPFRLSANLTSDGSTALQFLGTAGRLGRFVGTGVLENGGLDPDTGRASATGKATFEFKNGDQLFLSFSASWDISSHKGVVSIEFNGGTGRFAGASGGATLICHTVVDRNNPLAFECNSKGWGVLALARR